MILKKQYSQFWPYLLLVALVTLVYFPTFSGEFFLDDRPIIENDPYVKNIHSPISYLGQEDGVTDECSAGDHHTGYYRPLINLTYSLDYGLWGLNALGFRTTNLLLHLLCCFVLFHFLQFLANDRYTAFWATLIFALHPVNTESVSWIGSRDNILVALFSLSSLFLYIKGWEGGSRLNRMASVLTFALAILSKEMGLMLLPVFFLYQRLLSRTRRNMREELFSYLPFIIVMAAYFFLRKAAITSYVSPFQMVDLLKSVCFAPYVILWNLRLIFLPYGLHSFVVDYPSTYLNWQFLAGLFYTGLFGTLVWRLRKDSLIMFSVLSFHVLLLPTLNIIPTSAISLVSMRWLYFPMAFLTIVFVRGIKSFLKANRFVAKGALCAILAYFGGYSYILNSNLWHNESSFFRQEVLNFGNYYYAGGLAANLFEQKEYQYAEKCFQIAVNRCPLDAVNYVNYSHLLLNTGRPDVALAYLKKAGTLSMAPNGQGVWFNNMGAAYFNLRDRSKSIEYFLKAVIHCPYNAEFRANLVSAYMANGDYAKASSMLEKGLKIVPDSVALLKKVALTYIEMKRYSDAARILKDIPKGKWGKYGVQELLEKAETGLLQSEGTSRGEIIVTQPWP